MRVTKGLDQLKERSQLGSIRVFKAWLNDGCVARVGGR
jgi:hypothetical protein